MKERENAYLERSELFNTNQSYSPNSRDYYSKHSSVPLHEYCILCGRSTYNTYRMSDVGPDRCPRCGNEKKLSERRDDIDWGDNEEAYGGMLAIAILLGSWVIFYYLFKYIFS